MPTLEKNQPNQPIGLDWDDPNHPLSPPKCACYNCSFYSGSEFLPCAVNPYGYPLPCQHWKEDRTKRTESCQVVPLQTGGFRLEFLSCGELFWSMKRFNSVEEAIEYAETAILNYKYQGEFPDDTYLLERPNLYDPVGDCIYKEWLIYTQFAEGIHLVNPETNELTVFEESLDSLLQPEQVDRAKDYIDEVERSRFVSPGQLTLFEM